MDALGFARLGLSLAVVIGLIFLAGAAFRRYGGAAHGFARSDERRLAVVETLSLDQKRRLILIRRDGVEHLVLVGGGQDLVVEAEISAAGPRPQTQPQREPEMTGARPLARAGSLGQAFVSRLRDKVGDRGEDDEEGASAAQPVPHSFAAALADAEPLAADPAPLAEKPRLVIRPRADGPSATAPRAHAPRQEAAPPPRAEPRTEPLRAEARSLRSDHTSLSETHRPPVDDEGPYSDTTPDDDFATPPQRGGMRMAGLRSLTGARGRGAPSDDRTEPTFGGGSSSSDSLRGRRL